MAGRPASRPPLLRVTLSLLSLHWRSRRVPFASRRTAGLHLVMSRVKSRNTSGEMHVELLILTRRPAQNSAHRVPRLDSSSWHKNRHVLRSNDS